MPYSLVPSVRLALSSGRIFLIAVVLMVTACSSLDEKSDDLRGNDSRGNESRGNDTTGASDPFMITPAAISSAVTPTQETTSDTATAPHKPSKTPTLKSIRPPASPTRVPTSTETPPPTNTATATIRPSPTIAGKCNDRVPSDDLLTLVTAEYGISADYVPVDLVILAEYLPLEITRGYETQLRQIALEPLLLMIGDMLQDDLRPEIISGYRSYPAQSIAWSKWLEREPDRAASISAPPGHSEHQLGTTLDFGSPELAEIIGEDDVDFHTYFYKTGEGEWLNRYAHEYGFTLSYPLEAIEITGFYYEPWHYRYIGVELATQLHDDGISLTQYLLEMFPAPCTP